MRSTRGTMMWSLLLLIVIGLTACGSEHEPPAAREGTAIEADVVKAETVETVNRIELHGTVHAERNATVSTRVMATVTTVRVDEGQSVREGQVLLEIDPQTARGQVAQAQGALGQARAALALARRNQERFMALAAADAASELELDQARMQYEQATAAVEQAEGALAAASSVANESIVVAPFEGHIARRMVDVGDMASPGRPLLTVESVGERRLVVAVPESVMARSGLGIGDSLEVRIDSRPELGRIEGTIVEVAAGADPLSHSLEIEIELPNVDLRTGASGRTWVPADSRTSVFVPAGAVLRRGGTSQVVVRDADGRASSRVVTLGESLADGRVEVLSGLWGGEAIVVGLTEAPRTGSVIRERTEGPL